jgi:two-component system OmpR family sensor kinase
MLRKSIRWRIQIWHGALLSLLVAGLLATFFVYERSERLRVIDDQLSSLATPLLPRFAPPGGPDLDGPGGPGPGPDRDRRNRDETARFEKGPFYYIAWSPDGEMISKSPTAPDAPIPKRDTVSGGRMVRTRGDFRELALFTRDDSAVLVGVSTAPLAANLRELAGELAAVGLAVVVFGLTGGWWVAGHVLRPIGQISATANQIAGGDRAKRINLAESDSELGQLAAVLNRTFDKLDHAFAQQVRFTADASHELRTPLSVILTQVQLALSRERSVAEYRQTLAICERAAERMRALVNSLLELARMDSGEFHLTLENGDVAKVAANALDLVAPLAGQKRATLHSSVESAPFRGDSVKLGQVLVNILQNAVQHNATGVEISLTVQRGEDKAFVRVSDNGAGIPMEALPHLFERFYRIDKSRSVITGGTGLGLAISKAIVEAHGGRISVDSKIGEGTTFLIVLPLVSSFTSS